MLLHNLPLLVAFVAMIVAAVLFAMLQFGGNESRQAILSGFGLLALGAAGLSLAMGDKLFQAGASERSTNRTLGLMADDLLPVQKGGGATAALKAMNGGPAAATAGGPTLAMTDRGYVRAIDPGGPAPSAALPTPGRSSR